MKYIYSFFFATLLFALSTTMLFAQQFFVTSTSPAMNALNVPANTNISITFDDLVPSSHILDNNTVIVTGSLSGRHSFTTNFTSGDFTVTIDPTNDFLPGEIVTFKIMYDIQNVDNDAALGVSKQYSFTVATGGDGVGYFGSSPLFSTDMTRNSNQQIYPADFDGDGDIDFVTYTSSDYVDYYKKGSSNEYTFQTGNQFAGGFNVRGLALSDMNRDQRMDVTVFHAPGGAGITTASVIINNAGTLNPPLSTIHTNATFNTTNNLGGLTADVDMNGYDDYIIINNGLTGAVPFFSNSGTSFSQGNSTLLANITSGKYWVSADLNNDGYPDFVGASGQTDEEGKDTIGVLLSTAAGTYASSVVYTTGMDMSIVSLAVGDVDGDGDIDIVVGDYSSTNNIHVFKNNGSGSFSTLNSYPSDISPKSLKMGDMDGDGDLDLVFCNGINAFGIAINNGSGVFNSVTSYFGEVEEIAVYDADGDGDLDVAKGIFYGMTESVAIMENTAPIAPTFSATFYGVPNNYGTQAYLSWGNGDGSNRIVVMKQGSAVDATPVDGTTYIANSVFGSGSDLGGGNYVVHNGSYEVTVTVTGLTMGEDYHIAIFEYNGPDGFQKYKTSEPGTGDFTAATTPEYNGEFDEFTQNYGTSVKVNFGTGEGFSRIVVAKQGSAVDATPTDNTTYTANSVFGSGTDLGGGNFVVYKGTNDDNDFVNVTGLTVNTTYHFAIFDFNGGEGTEKYAELGGEYNIASVTTNSVEGYPFDAVAGKALSYNGNNYGNIQNYYELPDGFTIEMWAKPAAIGEKMVLLSHDGGENVYLWLGIDETGKFFGENATGENTTTVTGTTTATANQWYHIALTGVSGGELKLYVNGVLEGSESVAELESDESTYWLAVNSNENYYYNGVIDEFRLWSAVRTASEIQANMHKTLSIGTPSNLVGYWQFNNRSDGSYMSLVNEIEIYAGTSDITSTAPVGGGATTNASVAESNTGPHTIGNATLSMSDAFDNPVDIYVSELSGAPSNFPAGYGSSIGSKYFIVELFGDPGTFSTDITFTFGPDVISPEQQSDPSTIHLFKRETNSANSWTSVGTAVSAISSTGEVTWSGITSFSQFVAIDLVNDKLPPQLTFTKADGADWTKPENQDRITDNVWLTRGNYRPLFNAKTESEYDYEEYTSPEGTKWAFGTTAEGIELLEFDNFRALKNSMEGSLQNIPGQDVVLHLIAEDIYLDVHFNSWSNDGGGFSYTRSLKPLELIQSGYSDIAATSVTLSGQIYSKNTTATAYLLYGTTSGVYTDSVLISPSTIPADTLYSISKSLTGLTEGITYYYRFAASNGTLYARSGERSVVPHTVQVWSKNVGTVEIDLSDENVDYISAKVWLKIDDGEIINAYSEQYPNWDASPAGTEWAVGTTENIEELTFKSFRDLYSGDFDGDSEDIKNTDLVLHLIEEDIYLDIKFTNFRDVYERSAAPLFSFPVSAVDVTYNSTTLNGKVFSNGLTASAYILYGTSNGVYTDSVAATPGSISASTLTEVSASIPLLAEGTTYYYSIAATNDNVYFRSASKSFTTFSSTIGSALKFDGNDDYVDVSTGESTLSAPFTIEAWLNPNSTSGTLCFFDTRSPSEHGFDVKLMNGNKIHADIGNGSGWITTDADADYNYSAGTWIHVAYVVTTTGYTIYVDGNEVGNGLFGEDTPLLFDVNHNIKIGRQGNNDEFFNGMIDDMRVWNVARTQQEIQDNMNVPFTSTQTGLVAYWQFNEISGTVANELIADYDGTLNNFNFDETSGWFFSTAPLPVELTSFTATSKRLNAELKWNTATEVNNYGFEVQRSEVREQKLEASWAKVGFVEGNGTTNVPKEYSFTDGNLKRGKYSYRLKQLDRDGKFNYSQTVEVEVGTVPKVFALDQNYPNPFNPSTTIGFTLEHNGLTTLKIYDIVGREVVTLVNNELLDAGVYHQKQFNASNLASGVYFARLVSGSKVQVKKLMLMK